MSLLERDLKYLYVYFRSGQSKLFKKKLQTKRRSSKTIKQNMGLLVGLMKINTRIHWLCVPIVKDYITKMRVTRHKKNIKLFKHISTRDFKSKSEIIAIIYLFMNISMSSSILILYNDLTIYVHIFLYDLTIIKRSSPYEIFIKITFCRVFSPFSTSSIKNVYMA